MTQPLTPARIAEMRARQPRLAEIEDVYRDHPYGEPVDQDELNLLLDAARTDLPALLDEVERLTRENQELRTWRAKDRTAVEQAASDTALALGPEGSPVLLADMATVARQMREDVERLTRERDEANARIRADEEGRVAWCRECGRVSSCDEDRCCSMCGYDLIVLADLHSSEVLEDYINECGERDEARAEADRLRARVAELEARPRVHPLAWRYLQAEHDDWHDESLNATHRMENHIAAVGAWHDAGCPLLADDDAETPEVPRG